MRSERLFLAATVSAVCLLTPVQAAAQAIGGTVADETGGVLPGVTVEARSPRPDRTGPDDGNGWSR